MEGALRTRDHTQIKSTTEAFVYRTSSNHAHICGFEFRHRKDENSQLLFESL